MYALFMCFGLLPALACLFLAVDLLHTCRCTASVRRMAALAVAEPVLMLPLTPYLVFLIESTHKRELALLASLPTAVLLCSWFVPRSDRALRKIEPEWREQQNSRTAEQVEPAQPKPRTEFLLTCTKNQELNMPNNMRQINIRYSAFQKQRERRLRRFLAWSSTIRWLGSIAFFHVVLLRNETLSGLLLCTGSLWLVICIGTIFWLCEG